MKLFFLLIFFNTWLTAQLVFQPVYNLSNTPSATSDYETAVSDGANYYVAWGDNGDIKYKYSSDYGATWSANVTVYYSSPNIAGWPELAADDNYVYLVYHQQAGDYEIVFQMSTNYGMNWTPGELISGMDIGAITPQISSDGNNLYVVYEQKVSNKYEIFFHRSTDRGLTWSAALNISNTPDLTSRWAQLQKAGNNLYCAWIDQSSYPLGDIYFSKSSDHGTTWSSPLNITNDSRPQNRFCMRAYGTDKIYIVSDDIITFNFDEVYFMKSTDQGSTWTTAVNITNNAGHSNTPAIQIWQDKIYFTWADNSHTAPAYDNMDIFFKWSADEGVTWHDSTNLSSNPETSSRPRICYGSNGSDTLLNITVVWYDYSTGDAEILARKGTHVVPVELLSFNAEAINNTAYLSWSTATEINNKGFELFRRDANISDWHAVGFVEGSGTTAELRNYSFIDRNLNTGTYYYRLVQIDYDNSREILKETAVEIISPSEFVLYQNYPNPFNPSSVIEYNIKEISRVKISVYNMTGEKLFDLVDEIKEPGRYKSEININNLASGIYFYRMSAGNFSEVKKMVLIR